MSYALISLAVVVIAILLLLFVKSRRNRNKSSRLPDQPVRLTPDAMLQRLKQEDRYRGVKINAHCKSAAQFAGVEYEFDAAPSLPISGCDSAVCECSFVGLPERRRKMDRRNGMDRRMSIRTESQDRRGTRPRRKDDLNWAAYQHL